MPSLLAFDYFVIGIYIAFSIGQVLLYIFSKRNQVNLYMVLLGILAAVYLYQSNKLHASDSLEYISETIIYQVTFYLLQMAVLFTIIYKINNDKNRYYYFGLMGFLIVSISMNLFLPNGIIYNKIIGVDIIQVFGNEYVLFLGEINRLYYPVAIVTYLAFISFLLRQIHLASKHSQNSRKLIFMFIVGLYLVSNIYDVMIDIRLIEGIFLTEYFMLPVLLLLNLDIFIEIKKGRYFESNYKKIQENFNVLIESVDLMVVAVDLKGHITYMNPYFLTSTGFTKKELLNKKFKSILLSPDNHEQFDELFVDILDKKSKLKIDFKILCKNGKNLIVNWSDVPIEDTNGNVVEVLGIGADITERMESRNKIIEALDELKKVKLQLEDENTFLKLNLRSASSSGPNMIGESDTMKYVYHSIEEVSKTDISVLIEGETGVGKELVARAIHDQSNRSEEAFIKVNCGALPRDLIESELFGHVKGAFTGAMNDRKGRFELAEKGSIFLDEIGELPLDLQSKLLRVLENSEFNPVGSERLKKVDVRVIAATNRNLKKRAQEGDFRLDLFYRLSVFPITVPPLRKRSGDIPLLVDFFLANYCEKLKIDSKPVNVSTLKKMESYSWPGNVRELKNVVERSVITSKNGKKLTVANDSLVEPEKREGNRSQTLQEVERNHIISILNNTNWKISGKNSAAAILDLNEGTLRSRMKKLDITRDAVSNN